MIDIIQGDCLLKMAEMPENSVDAIVTDPPYGISFMGKDWDHGVPGVPFWTEALRVLKPGGHMLAFGGSRTFHRLVCAIEDAGFEIRDQIMWLYGSGFPKSKNLDGEWQGWGTALKPAHEPICVARKPLQGTVAANWLNWGTGAINVDGCRVRDGSESGADKPKYDANYSNAVFGMGMGGGAWENTSGRWPANVIHDGSHEVVALFPGDGDKSASRFFYAPKASKKDRGEGNGHPTVKPTDLMRYLCRLVTPPGGVVLDPFCGSGSTGKAAVLEGFRFIGIELQPEYAEIARARVAAAMSKLEPMPEPEEQMQLFTMP